MGKVDFKQKINSWSVSVKKLNERFYLKIVLPLSLFVFM